MFIKIVGTQESFEEKFKSETFKKLVIFNLRRLLTKCCALSFQSHAAQEALFSKKECSSLELTPDSVCGFKTTHEVIYKRTSLGEITIMININMR
jgi:hypothetical protein